VAATATPDTDPLRERLRPWLEVSTAAAPSVSHDGESVLFLWDSAGIPEAWRIGRDGSRPSRLFGGEERVGAVFASPHDPRAVVAVDSGGNEHWQFALVSLEEPATTRALTHSPRVIHSSGRWTEDGRRFAYTSNERDNRFFDVYELEVDRPGSPRTLLRADATHSVLDTRGSDVLVARSNTSLDVDLLLIQGDRAVHLNPHEGEQTVFSAALAADGVYAGANPGRELAALVRLRPGRASHEFLREYPGDVELVRASRDGALLLLSVNRDGRSETHIFDPATGEDRPLLSGPRGVIGGATWLPDASAFVYELASPEGHELYLRSVATGKEKRLTRSPRPLPGPTAEARAGRFRAEDGLAVPYWEYSPAGREPRGTVLFVHGGPEGQDRPGFDPFRSFFLGEGWRVVAPNVRGSTGYGRTYVHLDDVRRRMDSVRDLRDLASHLFATGRALPGRLGILGGSYGGFMVLSATSTYPDLWAAAVDIVGIANFVTFLENTGPWRRALREAEYGSLARDREFLESISPVHHAERIRAPLFVIHGRNDPRVPLGEAEQIVETLRRLGRDVEFLVFDNEGHGIVRRENRLAAGSRIARFFENHIADGTSASSPEAAGVRSGR
jgi:dipeptidyl aminopeptidase/acylaminoacyl peptidase